jgi:hypothetical protein
MKRDILVYEVLRTQTEVPRYLISYQRSRCSRKTGVTLAKAGIAEFYLEQQGTGGREEEGEATQFWWSTRNFCKFYRDPSLPSQG